MIKNPPLSGRKNILGAFVVLIASLTLFSCASTDMGSGSETPDKLFLQKTDVGAYDLSLSGADPVFSYVRGQNQLSTSHSTEQICSGVADFHAGKAFRCGIPASISQGDVVKLSIKETGLSKLGQSNNADVTCVKIEGNAVWVVDAVNKVGFIIKK